MRQGCVRKAGEAMQPTRTSLEVTLPASQALYMNMPVLCLLIFLRLARLCGRFLSQSALLPQCETTLGFLQTTRAADLSVVPV